MHSSWEHLLVDGHLCLVLAGAQEHLLVDGHLRLVLAVAQEHLLVDGHLCLVLTVAQYSSLRCCHISVQTLTAGKAVLPPRLMLHTVYKDYHTGHSWEAGGQEST